ncbi:hypothetical protein [Lewinella sp. LCG006]|uniref:hypothetical protein n=1 Tax=Lewinella sp. LCG006 TaxID=3231911 RepID=UPI003460C63A
MTQNNKKVVSAIITIEIDSHSFDYEVSSNIHGEVQQVKSLFLELPEAAQRLTMIKDLEIIKPKIEAWGKLFHFYVPAQLVGMRKGEDLQPLIEELVKLRQSAGLSPKSHHLKDLTHPWHRAFWKESSLLLAAYNKDKKDKRYGALMFLFQDKDEKILFKVIRHQSEHPTSVAEELLRAKIPILSDENKAAAYRALKSFPSEDTRSFLLKAYEKLEGNESKMFSSILYGLSAYKDEVIYQLTLDAWKSLGTKRWLSTNFFFAIFANFEQPEVIDIAWQGLTKSDASLQSYDLLKDRGISDLAIFEAIWPVLNSTRDKNNFECLFETLSKIYINGNPYLLPSGDEILDLYQNFFLIEPNLSKYYSISIILHCVYNNQFPKRLYEIFQEENITKKKFALMVSANLLQYNPKALPLPTMRKKVEELITENTSPHFYTAVSLLKGLAIAQNDKKVITQLLEVLNIENLHHFKHILKAINEIMREIGYEKAVTKPYLKLLKNTEIVKNWEARNEIFIALKMSADQSVFKWLEQRFAIRIQDDFHQLTSSGNNDFASYHALMEGLQKNINTHQAKVKNKRHWAVRFKDWLLALMHQGKPYRKQ